MAFTGVVDRGAYWVFPALYTEGIAVEKSDGRVTSFASWGADLESTLWAYERGLFDPSRACLVVDEVHDFERTLDAIRALRRDVRYETRRDVADKLAVLPAAFPHTLRGSSGRELLAAEGAFLWRACRD
jgi:hypothetical protein